MTQLFLRSPASGLGTGKLQAIAGTRGTSAVTSITNTAASGTNIVCTDTAGGNPLSWWFQVGTAFTLSGNLNTNIYATESSTAANAAIGLLVEHYGPDATTLLGTILADQYVPTTATELTTINTNVSASALVPTSQSMAIGDFIKITLKVRNVGTMASGFTVTMSYNGPTASIGDTYVNFADTFSAFTVTLVAKVPVVTGSISGNSVNLATMSGKLPVVKSSMPGTVINSGILAGSPVLIQAIVTDDTQLMVAATTNGSGALGAQVNAVMPAGTVQDSLVLAFVTCDWGVKATGVSGGVIIPPDGSWVFSGYESTPAGAPFLYMAIYYRWSPGADGGQTFPWNTQLVAGNSPIKPLTVTLARIANGPTNAQCSGWPFVDALHWDTANETITIGSFTPGGNNTLMVACVADYTSPAGSVMPALWWKHGMSTVSVFQPLTSLGSYLQPVAGSTGPLVFDAGYSDVALLQMVSIRPPVLPPVTGTLIASVPTLTAALTGTQVNSATLSAAVPVLTATLGGTSPVLGTLSASVPVVTAVLPATMTNAGTLSAKLPVVTTVESGTETNPATLIAKVPVVTGTASGTVINPAALAPSLPVLRFAENGTMTMTGTLAASVPLTAFSMLDTTVNGGVLAARVPLPTWDSGIGTQLMTGTLVAKTPLLTGRFYYVPPGIVNVWVDFGPTRSRAQTDIAATRNGWDIGTIRSRALASIGNTRGDLAAVANTRSRAQADIANTRGSTSIGPTRG